ncbi:MAG: carboxylesterase family protein [Myxococcota bacterium]|nr:carboxylesterase family protein [Myxococcota bacterium]
MNRLGTGKARGRRSTGKVLLAGVLLAALSLAPGSRARAIAEGADGARPPCDGTSEPIATAEGPVCGVVQRHDGAQAFAYLGIPFAAPPAGERRWRNPAPPAPRNGLFRATEAGALCTQPGAAKGTFTGGEDCLYLNVWTPRTDARKALPVLVYLPGGGFVVGGGSLDSFNGTYLAGSGDVVVVTMNYRLGALGFLRYLEGGSAIAGNFAIRDQMAAMQWVQKNIAAFGGDPTQVTLFGESAGAMSAGLHLFSIPESDAFFRAVIMESNVMSVPYADAAQAAARGAGFVDALCRAANRTSDCPRDGAWLRSLPLETILQAEWAALPRGGMPGLLVNGMALGMLWAPTVGVPPIVGQADEGFHPGSSPKPYVFGINRNEGFFFVPTPGKFSESLYLETLAQDFGAAAAQRIVNYEAGGTRPYDPASYEADPISGMSPAAQAMAWVITDYAFGAGNLRSALAAWKQMEAAGEPIYGYYFTEVSNFSFTGLQRCSPQTGHVCHTDELPYVFHNLLEKSDGTFRPAQNVTPEETALANAMSAAWIRFAKDPAGKDGGWGHPALRSVTEGPYTAWQTPPATVNDLGTLLRYELWSTITPVAD